MSRLKGSSVNVPSAVPSPDAGAMAAARWRQEQLTKPAGSLGDLETIAIRLAGIVGERVVCFDRTVLVFAADHGVAKHGVSAYPQAVTAQMLRNFDKGGAAINVLAAAVGASLTVVDVGVIAPPEGLRRVRSFSIRQGSRDMTVGPAMSVSEARQAMQVGADIVDAHAERPTIIALGEMGIANTTSSAAITSIICGCAVDEAVGPGTGLAEDGVRKKADVIRRAIEVNSPNPFDPMEILACVGGLETAALVGAIIRAAELRLPVVMDGYTVGAAALLAEMLAPGSRNYLFAGHLSCEPGHAVQLRHLMLHPILSLKMRLGEGSGAAMALAVVDAAWRLHTQMSTFAEAQVDR